MTIRDFNFKCSALVLVCNTVIEKVLNCKMRPWYLGPMIVVSHNRGGAYIICDLDGTLVHAPIAAFRVIPYFVRKKIDAPDLDQHIDVSVTRLCELKDSVSPDPDNPEAESTPIECGDSDDGDGDSDNKET